MGLIVDLFRSDYDSNLNAFHGFKSVTVVNLPGPFEPTDERPAAVLMPTLGAHRELTLVADKEDEKVITDNGYHGPMFGGTFAYSSNAGWTEATDGHAVHVHDRYERVES